MNQHTARRFNLPGSSLPPSNLPPSNLPPSSLPRMMGIAVLLCLGLWLALAPTAFAQDAADTPSGYTYTVQQGDSWQSVATSTGVSMDDLKAANPDAVRANDWLLLGEELLIPTELSAAQQTHVVQAGESWNSIAQQYGISADLLRAANPQAVRPGNILFRGEQLIIPPVGATAPDATPTPAPTPPPAPTVTPTAEPEATPSAEATAEASAPTTTTIITVEVPVSGTTEVDAPLLVTDTASATVPVTVPVTVTVPLTLPVIITATTTITDGTDITTTAPSSPQGADDTAATESAFDLPACPERFADYVTTMTALINSDEMGPAVVIAFLDACDALVEDGAVTEDLTGDGIADLVAAYINPSPDQVFVEADLIIFNSSPDGYILGYRARAAGEVRLLNVGDLNLDQLPDVAWVDTTCGASTCFDTVNVRSWDGSAWADWTEGTITMAYAEITLDPSASGGQGDDITLEGGIYGSVGAGPQRSRTEVWSSAAGAPYALTEKSYSRSECLYHTVLDANRAFLAAPTEGFTAAQALYTQAVSDDSLIKCWVRSDELDELRSFSQFRLALIAAYNADAEGAAAAIDTLQTAYPAGTYAEVGGVWLESYQADGDVTAACEAVTEFAQANSEAWETLADYGYTNPSFEAVDICPILELSEDTAGASRLAPSPVARILGAAGKLAGPSILAVPTVG